MEVKEKIILVLKRCQEIMKIKVRHINEAMITQEGPGRADGSNAGNLGEECGSGTTAECKDCGQECRTG